MEDLKAQRALTKVITRTRNLSDSRPVFLPLDQTFGVKIPILFCHYLHKIPKTVEKTKIFIFIEVTLTLLPRASEVIAATFVLLCPKQVSHSRDDDVSTQIFDGGSRSATVRSPPPPPPFSDLKSLSDNRFHSTHIQFQFIHFYVCQFRISLRDLKFTMILHYLLDLDLQFQIRLACYLRSIAEKSRHSDNFV
jgi:hypothetical protein